MNEFLGNRYELMEKIGEGGMSIVFKAKCHLLNRFVAVKILKEEFNTDADFVEKFKKEATAAASLSHPNIVNIYDVGSENNINYIVMEYVEGNTLKQLINENQKLCFIDTINIAIQIASALDCAHKNNLIHRDIKPHNILVTKEGVAKVADFGIAKVTNSVTVTNSSQIMGSAHYFSPEQAKGGFVDNKSDIYSLGIVIYEMITGKVPYDAQSPVSVAIKHIQEKPIPPKQLSMDIPNSLNVLILKAIEKEPINRYHSIKEMLDDLNKIKNNPDFIVKTNNLDNEYTRIMTPIDINEIENINDETDEIDTKTKKKPMKKSVKIALIISLCLLVPLIGVFAGKLIADNSSGIATTKNIKVPKIMDMQSEDAQKSVENLGLKYVVADTEESEKEVGVVTKCNYNEGDLVEKGTTIRVTVSAGVGAVKLSDLVNSPKDVALDKIKADGFIVGDITEEYSDTVIQGNVKSQYPEAGTSYQKGKKVNIVVSKGIEQVKVSNFKDKSLNSATAQIAAEGFVVGEITHAYSDTVGKDNVISQSPDAGTNTTKGKKINLVVSDGPKPVEKVQVPDLVEGGLTPAQADAKLKALGLKMAATSTDNITGDEDNDGKIFEQDPVAGTKVEKGTIINVRYYKVN